MKPAKRNKKSNIDMAYYINVDEKNKVVVCEVLCRLRLEKVPFIPAGAINETLMRKLTYIFGIKDNKGVTYGLFKAKAIAKCNSTDIFNPEFGTKIAVLRARAKAFRMAAKAWSVVENYVKQSICEQVHVYMENAQTASSDETLELGELLKKE